MSTQSTPRVLGAALAVAVVVVVLSIQLNAFRDYQIAEIAIEVTAVAGEQSHGEAALEAGRFQVRHPAGDLLGRDG